MKIAIMQPYFFPYGGYFKLINEVDLFVFLTDVQFVKNGWIHRNRIRKENGFQYLSVPTLHSPQKTNISLKKIDNTQTWKEHHCKILSSTFGKRASVHPLYKYYTDLHAEENLVNLLKKTIKYTSLLLGITTEFVDSMEVRYSPLKGEEGILQICKLLNAEEYLNAVGGRHLYNEANFKENGIKLSFTEPLTMKNHFSILDLMIGDGIESINEIT